MTILVLRRKLPLFSFAAVSATISQIPTVNFFRGIGYFNTACSLVVLVLMVVLFRDKAKVNLKVCKERMLGCCRMGKLDLSFTKVIVSSKKTPIILCSLLIQLFMAMMCLHSLLALSGFCVKKRFLCEEKVSG